MGGRRSRAKTEDTFLEHVCGRLSTLEALVMEVHWSTVGQWHYSQDLAAGRLWHVPFEEGASEAKKHETAALNLTGHVDSLASEAVASDLELAVDLEDEVQESPMAQTKGNAGTMVESCAVQDDHVAGTEAFKQNGDDESDEDAELESNLSNEPGVYCRGCWMVISRCDCKLPLPRRHLFGESMHVCSTCGWVRHQDLIIRCEGQNCISEAVGNDSGYTIMHHKGCMSWRSDGYLCAQCSQTKECTDEQDAAPHEQTSVVEQGQKKSKELLLARLHTMTDVVGAIDRHYLELWPQSREKILDLVKRTSWWMQS